MVETNGIKWGMDLMLKKQLDTLIYNLQKDWDFLILISGSGWVRVGKSVMAMLNSGYCANKLGTPFTLNNICFNGKQLIDRALKAPRNSVFVYDEAQIQLSASAAMRKINQDINNFFIECGQLNHLVFLVVPDFFAMKKYLAVNRSVALIDVQVSPEKVKDKDVMNFRRGRFRFFNFFQKRMLYNLGKKRLDDYTCIQPSFRGTFPNTYVIDEKAYRKKKEEFLKREREVEKENRFKVQRDKAFEVLTKDYKHPLVEVTEFFNRNNPYPMVRSGIGGAVIKLGRDRNKIC